MDIKTRWNIGDVAVWDDGVNSQVGVVMQVRAWTDSGKVVVRYGVCFIAGRDTENKYESELVTPDEWLTRAVTKHTKAIEAATLTVEWLKEEVARKEAKP